MGKRKGGGRKVKEKERKRRRKRRLDVLNFKLTFQTVNFNISTSNLHKPLMMRQAWRYSKFVYYRAAVYYCADRKMYFFVYCILCIVYCVLCIVYCLLYIVYCVLFIVYCVLCIVLAQ